MHKIEATKGVEDIFKFMLMSSDSGRFFLIYVNEVGKLHGIYHADWYLPWLLILAMQLQKLIFRQYPVKVSILDFVMGQVKIVTLNIVTKISASMEICHICLLRL